MWTRWRARRRRRAFARLMGKLETDASDAAYASAARLAVLTHQLAAIERTGASLDDVQRAHAIAVRARDDYAVHVTRARGMRDRARAEVDTWRNKLATAEACGARELIEPVHRRIAEWEQQEREASALLDECIAAQCRLGDAVGQLQRLVDQLERARSQHG